MQATDDGHQENQAIVVKVIYRKFHLTSLDKSSTLNFKRIFLWFSCGYPLSLPLVETGGDFPMINGPRRPNSRYARGTRLFPKITAIGCQRADRWIGCRGNRRRNFSRNSAEASAGLAFSVCLAVQTRRSANIRAGSDHTDSSLKADNHPG